MKISLLRQLKKRYLLEGLEVYSRYFSELSAAPPDWKGGYADLIVDSGGERTALFLVSEERLSDPQSAHSWAQAAQNTRTRLKLLVAKKSFVPQVERLLGEKKIDAKVALIRRTSRTHRTRSRRRRILVASIFFVLLATALVLSDWGSKIWNANTSPHYEPRDLQRQQEVERSQGAQGS